MQICSGHSAPRSTTAAACRRSARPPEGAVVAEDGQNVPVPPVAAESVPLLRAPRPAACGRLTRPRVAIFPPGRKHGARLVVVGWRAGGGGALATGRGRAGTAGLGSCRVGMARRRDGWGKCGGRRRDERDRGLRRPATGREECGSRRREDRKRGVRRPLGLGEGEWSGRRWRWRTAAGQCGLRGCACLGGGRRLGSRVGLGWEEPVRARV